MAAAGLIDYNLKEELTGYFWVHDVTLDKKEQTYYYISCSLIGCANENDCTCNELITFCIDDDVNKPKKKNKALITLRIVIHKDKKQKVIDQQSNEKVSVKLQVCT